RNDHIFAAPFEIKIAFCVHRAQITGAKPAFSAGHGPEFLALPVLSRHVLTPHQDLATLRIELHLAPGQDLADRPAPHLERMVQADERTGLREPVALYHHVAQPPPELFRVLVERGPAGDDGPELPAKAPAHPAETPPA